MIAGSPKGNQVNFSPRGMLLEKELKIFFLQQAEGSVHLTERLKTMNEFDTVSCVMIKGLMVILHSLCREDT